MKNILIKDDITLHAAQSLNHFNLLLYAYNNPYSDPKVYLKLPQVGTKFQKAHVER